MKPTKPFTVARNDFATNLLTLINESGLPAVTALSVVSEVHEMLAKAANEQYNRDLAEYNKKLEEYENSLKKENDESE